MEGEGLEARQAPRWSDAEAAENRARRRMAVPERLGAERHTPRIIMGHDWGSFGHEGSLLRMRQAAAKGPIVGIGFMRRP
jgi:hypothetical protein